MVSSEQVKNAAGSLLAGLSASNMLAEGHLFIVLKMYSDGSGKDNQRDPFLTLAGFAASPHHWIPVEQQWNKILSEHPLKPSYMHMNEAFSLKEGFPKDHGWTIDKVIGLCLELNEVLSSLPRDKFCAFRHTTDLKAYRYWRHIVPNLMSASRRASLDSFLEVFKWWSFNCPEPLMDKIDMIYDRSESFLGPLYNYWIDKEQKRLHPQLHYINTVSAGDAKQTPPLQAADMLAWCTNRLKVGPRDASIDHLCNKVVWGRSSGTCVCETDAEWLRQKYSRIIIPENMRS
jgi:hypothetical protein